MFKEMNSLRELEQTFPTEESCIEHFVELRWPHGIACPHCGSFGVYELKRAGYYKCSENVCHKKFSWRYDSIFCDAKIPLRTWFKAIFLTTSFKKGISSVTLSELLDCTQKTAWFLLHRLREATMTEDFAEPLMTGTIQADETLVGGKEHFKHANKRTANTEGRGSMRTKTMVLGMVNPGGELRLKKLRALTTKEIQSIVEKNVLWGAAVHTDEATHYKWMTQLYRHNLVKHRMGQYVSEDGITTNAIEGAFSHFKRSIVGVFHKVSDEHIDKYLSAFAWRWTRRKMTECERVNGLLKATPGHRLTYKQLTRQFPRKG